MEMARWVWVGERDIDQIGPEGRGVVCCIVKTRVVYHVSWVGFDLTGFERGHQD